MHHARTLLASIVLALVAAPACSNGSAPAREVDPTVSVPEPAPTTSAAPESTPTGEPTASPEPTASAPPPASTTIDPKLLVGTWVQSYEEGSGVYRHEDFKSPWPPSHFRGTFTIAANGVGSFNVLAPNDAHFTVKGRWVLRDDGTLTFTATETVRAIQAGSVRTIQIATLSKDKLELTKDSSELHSPH